jgi:hypothetical protein
MKLAALKVKQPRLPLSLHAKKKEEGRNPKANTAKPFLQYTERESCQQSEERRHCKAAQSQMRKKKKKKKKKKNLSCLKNNLSNHLSVHCNVEETMHTVRHGAPSMDQKNL